MTLSLKQLTENPMQKGDAIALLGLKTFDYALPEPWLRTFCNKTGLDRYLVLSTTVWSYDVARVFGAPVSICMEVQDAIDQFNAVPEGRAA